MPADSRARAAGALSRSHLPAGGNALGVAKPTRALSSLALVAVVALAGCTDARDRRAEAAGVSGASVEPTPHRMSSASDRLVRARRAAFASQLAAGQRSLSWRLVELREGGRLLVIDYSPGCEDDRGTVQIEETSTYALVRVSHPEAISEYGCVLTWRRIVELSQPLGDRQLLHAP